LPLKKSTELIALFVSFLAGEMLVLNRAFHEWMTLGRVSADIDISPNRLSNQLLINPVVYQTDFLPILLEFKESDHHN
jgi:hypothetical protein